MKEDEAIIEQYKIDTKKVQQKISDLRSGAVTFQVRLGHLLTIYLDF